MVLFINDSTRVCLNLAGADLSEGREPCERRVVGICVCVARSVCVRAWRV